ncbi:hypothetical protein T08_15089 [Trichinella sp. T8]|nr:hypothetical protein T08_15089 [Trichinella sp. T8]
MQITIAIKVPYHQLECTRSFDYVASGSVVQRMEQRKSENTDDIEANHGRREAEQEKTRALWRRVLTKSMFLLLRFLSHSHINVLIGRIEQCISPVDCGIG